MTDKSPSSRIPHARSLQAVRALVDRTLRTADAPVRGVTRYLAGSGGKGLRAALLLAAATGPDETVPEEAIRAAAAIELMHLATLVHDDVVDDAATRRGKPSVQKRFGQKSAVLSGDYLFCTAFALAADVAVKYPTYTADFTKAITRICLGEIDQLAHNHDTGLTITGYLRIIAGKTAALFALAAYAGTVLSGATEREAKRAGRFGYLFGMMFQIADDCLDYEDDGSTSLKTSGKDLSEGVITPPVIYAMATDPSLKDRVRAGVFQKSDMRQILTDIVRAGGVRGSRVLAARYERKLGEQLARIGDAGRRRRLQVFLDQAARSTHGAAGAAAGADAG